MSAECAKSPEGHTCTRADTGHVDCMDDAGHCWDNEARLAEIRRGPVMRSLQGSPKQKIREMAGRVRPSPTADPIPTLDGLRGGETFVAAFDYERLNGQQKRVYDVLRDGQWHTLGEIAERTGDPEASISARIRDLRKDEFGRLDIGRRRRGDPRAGLFEYRLR